MRFLLIIFLSFFACASSPNKVTPGYKLQKDWPTVEVKAIEPLSVIPLMEKLDKLDAEKAPGVIIKFDSGGGEVELGYELAEKIEKMSIPVVCVVDKQAMSMAFAILQSCPVRLVTKRSELMMHEVSVVAPRPMNAKKLKALADHLELMNEIMVQHVAARLKLKDFQIRENIDGKDWFISWKEAIEIGAADGWVDHKDIPKPVEIPKMDLRQLLEKSLQQSLPF